MDSNTERRREQRLRYHWPVWFAEDFNDMLAQGQMVDVSSGGAAFTCYANDDCPRTGQHITARFSVPQFEDEGAFDMANFIRSGHVCRVEDVNNHIRRVAIQFAETLPFKPGEQSENEADAEKRLSTIPV